jgi:subtilisin family serine protease
MSADDYTFTWTGSVNGDVPKDYFRFQLSSSSNFNLSLTGLSADADLELYNLTSGQVLLASSENPGSQDESIFRQLTSGFYGIRILSYKNSSTSYRLTLSATGTDVDSGNTLAAARDLGELSRSFRTRPDDVGNTDPIDYYRFELRESTTLSLSLTGLQGDVDVSLLDIEGTEITYSINAGTASEFINQVLNPGTYYVEVYRAFTSVNSSYNLRLDGSRYDNPSPGFNSTYGYGLVNAAAAVARAVNQATFTNVTDLGGVSWDLDLVKAPEVWARGYTGLGITVAVIDSGVDINHPDLVNNIWRNPREIANNGIDDDGNGYIDDIYGWNFGIGQNNNNILPGTPFNDHGTHVAGTIAASRNNLGVTGVAPNARIMALRLGDVDATGSYVNSGDIASAIRYAVDNGARVINLSVGWSNSRELRNALAYANSRNVTVVSSAGNYSVDSPGNPAQYAIDYGIAVGAVDIQQTIAGFSNRAGSDSRMQYVVAPGVKIYSTVPGNQYGFKDGTSMAAPHIAGVVALMLSANPNLTPAQVRQILTSTATRLA